MDVPVTQVELEHAVSAGLQVRALVDGLVPLQEEHAARLERGFRLQEWQDLPYMEKVLIVAHRRVSQAMSNLQAEAEIRDMERKSRRRR